MIKKAFTLIEIVLVLLIISILLVVTMRFGSYRIGDLKAQSSKESFESYYRDLSSQNLTSSFRDGVHYERLSIVLDTAMSYQLDSWSLVTYFPQDLRIQNIFLWSQTLDFAHIVLTPYHLGCVFSSPGQHEDDTLRFELFVPENGKKYCFEIAHQTCTLREIVCGA